MKNQNLIEEGFRIIRNCGFLIEETKSGYKASTEIPSHYISENIPSNIYGVDIEIEKNKVSLKSRDPFLIALVADEIAEIEPFNPDSLEEVVSRYPQTVREISKKTLLSENTIKNEMKELQRKGFVQEENGIYYHSSWERDILPLELLEKKVETLRTLDEIDSLFEQVPEGTRLEVQLEKLREKIADKSIFYKALAIGGSRYAGI